MKKIIEATNVSNRTFVNVDIQPEYKHVFSFPLPHWINFLNQNYNHVRHMIFLYNGKNTVGEIDEMDYKVWLSENGAEDNVIESAIFYDKGYAFFRNCMDRSIDEDDIVDFVKFMIKNDITDSREMTKELWKTYAKRATTPLDKRRINCLVK